MKWTSSKPEIVTVTGDGYLYAKAQGDAVITVSDASGNYQAACSVTVKRNTADTVSYTHLMLLRFSVRPPRVTKIGPSWIPRSLA